MRKIILFCLLFFLNFNNASASTNTASSYILMDQTSGRVLLSKDMNNQKLIASITKIMSCTY